MAAQGQVPLFYIDRNFIDYLKNLVYFYINEFCGNLANNNGLLYAIEPVYAGPEINVGQRGVCIWGDPKTPEYFHTHPSYSSKTYPSYEDIFSIAGHEYKDRRISIIGSLWGIWYIYKNNNHQNLRLNQADRLRLQNVYENELSRIFYDSSYSYDYSESKSRPYSENVKENIYYPVELFNAEFNNYCNLGFIDWDSLERITRHHNIVPFYRFQERYDLGFFLRNKRKVSRKSHKASRKSHKASRKSHKASRKSHKASRKSHKASRKSHKASRKSHKVSRKSHKDSRKNRK